MHSSTHANHSAARAPPGLVGGAIPRHRSPSPVGVAGISHLPYPKMTPLTGHHPAGAAAVGAAMPRDVHRVQGVGDAGGYAGWGVTSADRRFQKVSALFGCKWSTRTCCYDTVHSCTCTRGLLWWQFIALGGAWPMLCARRDEPVVSPSSVASMSLF